MLVNDLLIYFKEDPRVYRNNEDKWIDVSGHIFNVSTPFFPLILATIPWLILLIWKKWTGEKITRPVLLKTTVFSIGLGIFGFFLPEIIIEILAGLAVRSLYGG